MPEDNRNEDVLKTRPKVYLSPQVSVDDVTDPDMRKMLLDYTYTSELQKTNSYLWNSIGIEYRDPETVVKHDKFLTSSNNHYFEVSFKPKTLLQVKMTPGQNFRGKHWEKDTIVGIANSTKYFWKHNRPKFDEQYDNPRTGYAAYKSGISGGLDFNKEYIPHHHPLRSTYQETFSCRIDPNYSKIIS